MSEPFYRRAVLPNGMRVLTSSMPHTHSVSLSLYVATGSRNEEDSEAGISHFVEHMVFKGTESRPTAKEIAEAIEAHGGSLNAATDREYTVYYAKVARPYLDVAMDVIIELVRKPLIEAAEMEKERQVIIEELAMVEDSPAQVADLALDAIMWPGNPLGRDVAGTPETVNAIGRETMLGYIHEQYPPNNMVLAIAGNIEHEAIIGALSEALADWQPGTPASWAPAPAIDGRAPAERCAVHYKKTEQAHLCLAVPGIPITHPDRHPLGFISVILGEGMSSRLFMELREKRGLVYDVHSYPSHFRDAGAFNVYTGVDPKNAYEALKVVLEELARMASEGPTEEEAVKARELSKGRLMLRMEDTRNVSGWVGGQELLMGQVRSIEDAVREMDAVTMDDLRRVAGEVLDLRRLHMGVVGPYRSDKRFVAALN
jgi:predicted Zn-dependent peptidase